MREVLLEDLIAHPLRGRILAALDLEMIGPVAAADFDAPEAGLLAVLGDGEHRAVDAKLFHRRTRNPFDILLFQQPSWRGIAFCLRGGILRHRLCGVNRTKCQSAVQASGAIGSVNRNVLPASTLLSAQIRPPCPSTMHFEM